MFSAIETTGKNWVESDDRATKPESNRDRHNLKHQKWDRCEGRPFVIAQTKLDDIRAALRQRDQGSKH